MTLIKAARLAIDAAENDDPERVIQLLSQAVDYTEQNLGMVGQPYGWIGKHSGEFIKNVGQGHVEGTPLYASEQAEQQAEGVAFKEKKQ